MSLPASAPPPLLPPGSQSDRLALPLAPELRLLAILAPKPPSLTALPQPVIAVPILVCRPTVQILNVLITINELASDSIEYSLECRLVLVDEAEGARAEDSSSPAAAASSGEAAGGSGTAAGSGEGQAAGGEGAAAGSD